MLPRPSIMIRALLLTLVAVTALAVDGPGRPATAQQPIVLRVTSQFKVGDTYDAAAALVRKKIQDKLGDKVRIRYLGGPEVIPGFEQAAALRDGTVDMLVLTTSWAASIWPMVERFDLSDRTPWEEREVGVFGFFEQGFAKHLNAKHLGRVGGGIPIVFYTKFKPTSVDDFKGRLLRVTPLHREAVTALGAKGVTIPPPELFAALQRGTVEGFGFPAMGLKDVGVTKLVKYRVEPAFYQQKWAVLVNQKVWNAMPADVQQRLAELVREAEREAYDLEWRLQRADTKAELEAGIQIVELSSGEADRYLKLVYDGKWKALMDKYPDEAGQLRKILVDAKYPRRVTTKD